jgi:hypothetical protein
VITGILEFFRFARVEHFVAFGAPAAFIARNLHHHFFGERHRKTILMSDVNIYNSDCIAGMAENLKANSIA